MSVHHISESELEQLEQELEKEYRHKRLFGNAKRTAFLLLTVAAVAVLVAVLWMPVLRIYGTSMTPTLYAGDIVVSVKATDMNTGDIIAFYYNNDVLVKRLIGLPGDWIDIDEDGNVYRNGEMLEEEYVTEKALGDCNILLPYQVPDNRYFVLGDHRSVSVDSRNTAVGCVTEDQIVGKITTRLWPLTRISRVR